jgi:hypothetical protein
MPSATRFVVAHVRQALQQTAAAGDASPTFAAACAIRLVKIVLTTRSYPAGPVRDRADARR